MVAFFCPAPFMKPTSAPIFDIALTGTVNIGTAASFTVDTGQPEANRIVCIVVGCLASSPPSVSAATIGGVAATVVFSSTGSQTATAMFYAKVPTGTSATVSITFSSARAGAYASAWRIVGQNSDTPTAFNAPAGGAAATRSATVNVLAGGGVIASVVSASATPTWSGITREYTFSDGSGGTYQGGHATVQSDGNVTISATSARIVAAASWR